MDVMEFASLIIESILTLAVSYAGWKFKNYCEMKQKYEEDGKNFKEMQMCTTQLMIIRECNHYIEKGFAPYYAVSSIKNMYCKYHDLGGNGGLEELYNEFLKLPHVAPTEE